MKSISLILLLSVFGAINQANSQNVLITRVSNPNEPSIKIDPKHPNRLVAGVNLNSYFWSSDTGRTWQRKALYSDYGVWGDPVIDVDTAGNFYFFHLSNPQQGNWVDRIVCQKSEDYGATWSDGTYTGLNGSKVQDKHWSVVDRRTNHIYITWTQFDQYESTNPADSTHIMFSKSTDEGSTWSDAKRINNIGGDCLDGSNTVEGAFPAVGPNGELYVVWSGPNGLVFKRSLDGGDSWSESETIIDSLKSGWNYNIPGISRANGLPILKCDLSGGANHGTLYVNWSDQRNGVDDTDIWLSKSTDGGNTWTAPIRVNNDGPKKQQFLTWMDIDQNNGKLYFVFYDRRDYEDYLTDVYLAMTDDGGKTFINKRISESPFLPNAGIFFGDYTNITVSDNIVRPIWARMNSGQLSVWTDITPIDKLLVANIESMDNSNLAEAYPNPAANISYVSFKLHELSVVKLEIYDQHGNLIHIVIDNENRDYGTYIIPIDIDKLNIPSGTYYYRLTINNNSKTLKTVITK